MTPAEDALQFQVNELLNTVAQLAERVATLEKSEHEREQCQNSQQ